MYVLKRDVKIRRLCTNPEIAKQVIELQGVTRLVRLCREERERNYSDGVLVACLVSEFHLYNICTRKGIKECIILISTLDSKRIYNK